MSDEPIDYEEIPVQRIGATVELKARHMRRIERAGMDRECRTFRAAERLMLIRLTRQLRRLDVQPLGPIELAYQPHFIRQGGILTGWVRGIAWPGPLPDDLAHWVPGDRCSVIVPKPQEPRL
jgi:hypothetical protein